jgi:hypothetical protein
MNLSKIMAPSAILTKDEYRKVYDVANHQSLGITLPKHLAISLSITSGDFVKMHQEEKRIVIEKA